MGIMTNRNACRGKLILFLIVLAVLASFQLGLAEDQEIEQFLKAAEQGDACAQSILGLIYANGEGVLEPQLTGDRATEESAQRHERVEEPDQRVGSGG